MSRKNLEEATTPQWEDSEVSEVEDDMEPVRTPKRNSQKHDPVGSWLAQKLTQASANIGGFLLTGGIIWSINVSVELKATTLKLAEISEQLKSLVAIDKRVSQIEATRYTVERGTAVERDVRVLQSEMDAVERRLNRVTGE
jgi:hypothetical protein